MGAEIPYWRLIAVLASNIPLSPPLAMRLYHAARDLHGSGDGVAPLRGDLAEGEVRNLKKQMVLGALAGPGFEAEVDTAHGHGRVRFIVTHEGLGEADDAPRAPRMAN